MQEYQRAKHLVFPLILEKHSTSHSPQPLGWGPGMLEVAASCYSAANHFNGFNYPHTNGEPHMSTHSYSRLWTHLVWETLNREPMLDKPAAAKSSTFLS